MIKKKKTLSKTVMKVTQFMTMNNLRPLPALLIMNTVVRDCLKTK